MDNTLYEEYVGTNQEDHDSEVASFISGYIKDRAEVTPAQAMDAIEVSMLSEENADTRGEDSNTAFMESIAGAVKNIRDGQDVREANSELIEEAAQYDNAVLADQLNGILLDPSISSEDKADLASGSKELSSSMNRMMTKASIARKTHLDNELSKTVEKPPADRSLWDKLTADHIFHYIETPEARDRALKGAVDSYLENTLFPLQWAGAAIKDIFTGAINAITGDDNATLDDLIKGEDGEYWQSAADVWEEWQVWSEYRKHESQKDPGGYAEGGSHGLAWSFIADPFAAASFKAVGYSAKSVYNVSKIVRSVDKLSKMVGKVEAGRIVSLSHKALVKTIQEADPELKAALTTIANSGENKVTKRISDALIETKGAEVGNVEMEVATAPLAQLVRNAVASGDESALENVEQLVLAANQPTMAEVDAIKTAFGAGEATPLTLLGVDDARTLSQFTDLSVKMRNAAAFKPVAEKIEYKAMSRSQELVEGIHSVRMTKALDDINEISWGVTPGTWSGNIRNRFMRAIFPATTSFKGGAKKDLVQKAFIAEDFSRLFKRAGGEMHEAVWKGLSKSDTTKLNNMARAANDFESWGKIVDNKLIIRNEAGNVAYTEVISPKLADRYIARKNMMGHLRDIANNSMRRQANQQGVKLFNGKFFARKVNHEVGGSVVEGYDLAGNKLLVQGSDKTYDMYRVDGAEDNGYLLFLTPEQTKSKIKKVHDTFDMMDNGVEGYMPIEYDSKYMLHEVVYESDKVSGPVTYPKGSDTPVVGASSPQARLVKEVSERKVILEDLSNQINLKKEAGEDVGELSAQYNKVAEEMGKYQNQLRLKTSTVALDAVDNNLPGIPAPKVTPIATASTTREANLYVKKAESEGRIVFASRSEPGQIDAAYSNNFMEDFFRMDGDTLERLAKGMLRSGLSEDSVNALKSIHLKYSKNPPAFKQASRLKSRADERLGHVVAGKDSVGLGDPRIRVAKEADALYVDWVSNYTGNVPVVENLISKFLEEYGSKALTDQTDWLSPIKGYGTISHQVRNEAKAIQDQLKALTGRKGALAVMADETANAIGDKVLNAKIMQNKVTGYVGEVMDTWMAPSSGLKAANQVTSAAKLGLLNLVQLPLQASFGILTATGSSLGRIASFERGQGGALVGGMNDFIEVLGPTLWNKSFKHTSKSSEVFEFLKRTGVLDGIDYDDLGKQLSNIRKNSSTAGSLMRAGVKKAGFAFTQGEKLNQVYALLLSRRVLAAEIKNGTHATLKATDLLNGGSAKFMEATKLRGKTLSLNMSRYNAPGFSRNPITGSIFKFKEFVSHSGALYLDPFFAKELSYRESAGIWMTTLAAIGPKGIPFLWDTLLAAEAIEDKIKISAGDVPDATGKYTVKPWVAAAKEIEEMTDGAVTSTAAHRWLTQGSDSALTDGQTALGARIQMGTFFSDFVDASATDEMLLGAVYSTVTGMMQNGVNTVDMMFDMMKNQDWDFERLALEASEEVSGVNSLIRGNSTISEDRLLSRTGKTLINDPSLAQRILVSIGMTPARQQTAYDLQSLKMKKQAVIADWMKAKVKEINQTFQVNKQMGIQQFRDTIDMIKEVDPTLGTAFSKAYVFSIKDSALDLETQVYIDSIVGGIIDKETAKIIGITPQK